MSLRSLICAGISIGLIGCASATPPASRPVASISQPADVVWFTGSSNIRSFKCSSTQVAVSAEAALEDFERTRADGVPAVKKAAMAIPVRSLDCGITKMNHDLFVTLGGDANPTISFALSDYHVLTPGAPGSVRMNGILRLGGTTNSMVVYGNVIRGADGSLRLRGERLIDVRDYGVKPPRRFGGLVRVRPEVEVHFDVAVRPLVDPLGILTSLLQ